MSDEKPPLPSGDVRIPVGPNLTAVYSSGQPIIQSANPNPVKVLKPKPNNWEQGLGLFCARFILRLFLFIFFFAIIRASCE